MSCSLCCRIPVSSTQLAHYSSPRSLPFFQSLLDEPNPNSPANSQAAQLYQENKREYEKRVSAIVEQSWRDSWPHPLPSGLLYPQRWAVCDASLRVWGVHLNLDFFCFFLHFNLTYLCTLPVPCWILFFQTRLEWSFRYFFYFSLPFWLIRGLVCWILFLSPPSSIEYNFWTSITCLLPSHTEINELDWYV